MLMSMLEEGKQRGGEVEEEGGGGAQEYVEGGSHRLEYKYMRRGLSSVRRGETDALRWERVRGKAVRKEARDRALEEHVTGGRGGRRRERGFQGLGCRGGKEGSLA